MAQQLQNVNSTLIFPVEQRGDPIQLNQLQRKQFYVAPIQSTGLWAEAGATLVVNYSYSGNSPNKNPQIWLHNITSGEDEESPVFQKVALKKGINNITAIKTGVLYIAASNAVDPHCAMAVTIQSGTRNMPTFVLGRDNQSVKTWREQVADASKNGSSPYAELVGQRMILTAPITDIETHATDPIGVLELWDKIVALADEQYGLAAGNAYPHIETRHRYHFFSKPDNSPGFMSSANEWLAANKSGLGNVLNTEALLNDGWGPYHELGHQYEVVAWKTDTEVLENLTSLYVQRALLGKASGSKERWAAVMSYLTLPSRDFDEQKDVWIKVAMFWQLNLTFGKDFYSRLATRYRMISALNLPASDDAKKERFIVEASRVAGFNLKPFFDQWGYTSTADTENQLTSLNLKTLNDPIWKNTDLDIAYMYNLDQQGIVGNLKMHLEVAPGEMTMAAVAIANHELGLTYKWTLQEGFQLVGRADTDNISFKTPANAIHNSFAPVTVTVSNSEQQSSIIGNKIKLRVVGEEQFTAESHYESLLMNKFNKTEIKRWSDTPIGIVGDIYRYDYQATISYFQLKTEKYWYFPLDSHNSNQYWEFIGDFNTDTYLPFW